MTTDLGRKYVLMRLSECPTLAALKIVWESIGVEYRNEPDIQAHKDRMKGVLE